MKDYLNRVNLYVSKRSDFLVLAGSDLGLYPVFFYRKNEWIRYISVLELLDEGQSK